MADEELLLMILGMSLIFGFIFFSAWAGLRQLRKVQLDMQEIDEWEQSIKQKVMKRLEKDQG